MYIIHIPWHFPLHKDDSITGSSSTAEKAFQQEYSAVYKHLLKYKNELTERNKAETGIRYEWYVLQRWGANYMDDFFKQKIVWGEISDRSKFAYDDKNYFVEATSFLLTGEKIKYLLGMLNSKLLEWYFNQIGTATGVGTNRWKKYTIELLPIKKPTEKEETIFLKLIERVLQNPIEDHKGILDEIDQFVYKLYNLNEEEISFISAVNIVR